ncbi:NFACT family protein [Candidatus Bathyarchaeota archaeon]|nr:NFACT family protein [Candidatus Bathyarchaeota archaeon]
MKKTMTSFDIATLVSELKEQLKGARIQNIYQIKGKTVILKLHQPNEPPLNLLIESGKRLHLTSYILEKPQRPPAFCMALRKYLRNATLAEISQYEFERIVTIRARTKEGEFKLVLELFGDGNIVLVDAQDIIQQALVFKKMRDRNILRGESFKQAPSSGRNPMRIRLPDLLELKKFEGLEVVKALTKLLSIGGMYAEEILLGAHVDKKKECKSLENGEFERIFDALNEVFSCLQTGKFEPCIMIDEKDIQIDVVPIPLKKYEELKCKKFASFNEALDEYYAKTVVEQEVTVMSDKVEEKIGRQQRVLSDQKESLEKVRREARRSRRVGDRIYAHFYQLQMLLQRIMDEKRNGKAWQAIISEIENEKKRGKAPSVYFDSLDVRTLVLDVSIGNLSFSLKLRKSVQENAGTYYERAKKAEKKVKGAEKAIEETLFRIEKLRQRKEIVVEETSKPIKKRRKKVWYEKFRWFYTSENLLVVGGKDAVTNEILIKKHTEPHDLVFHADIAGAPFVIIKAEGKTPSQKSITEAAQLAASHSRAWKAKFSAIDVYWVHPEQVSKTPPSGEYLKRGAFMIRGKKNYVRRTPLQLAIGIDIERTPLTLIGGPKEAVKSRTDICVEIAPGDLSSSKLANKIRHMLKHKVSKNIQEKVSKIPIEEIQAFIPFGKGKISN